MTQPRLFADYAHQPTRRERTTARHAAERQQLELLTEPDTPKPDACPVCAGDHDEPCHHGTAPTLPETTRSGFDWADVEFRFCTRNETHYAYGPTPEASQAKFATLTQETTP